MKSLLVLMLIVFLTGCGNIQPLTVTDSPATFQAAQPSSRVEGSVWSIYDLDPAHPWNRVFRQLYRRATAGGEEYGADELDPLLWVDTTHLLTGNSHRQTIQILDAFLSSHAEDLIRDPLKRAMFQRDLWAVFDWAVSQAEPYPDEREALQVRLAEIMKRVALTREEILALPENYALAVESGTYPAGFQADHPETAFLPPDLLQAGSDWVPLGRVGGPVAMTHTETFPFFGRSVFQVITHSPDGREATLDFIGSLNTEPTPVTAIGSQVALVRRMFLIDDQGDLVLSPLVETVQLRHFNPEQTFYEFELDRNHLFEGLAGGLIPKDELFMLFMSHGDVFEHSLPKLQAGIPEICKACHFEYPPIPNSGSTRSIISYSRQPIPLSNHEKPVLFETTLENEAQTVIQWKQEHNTWKPLISLWERTSR